MSKEILRKSKGGAIRDFAREGSKFERTSMSIEFSPNSLSHQTKDSIGADLRSTEDVWLWPFSRKAVGTGLYIVEHTKVGNLVADVQIRPRSGLAFKKGITVLNSPGTIDGDYRKEIKVLLINLSFWPKKISKGERIAQIVVCTAIQVFHVIDNKRTGGFNSTGSN